jgi:hypothetical protein
MPNNIPANAVEIEEYEEEEIDADDFGFIIGPDGELKSLMYPEHLMEDPPEEIKMILRIFGIDSIDDIDNRTLH